METLVKLQELFRDIFDDETLIILPESNAADISGWDSLTHIVLAEEIQQSFDIRLTNQEIVGIHSVQDILDLISKHS